MRVELGPVDARSVRSFADYGQKVLAAPVAKTLPDDVYEAFEEHLAVLATRGQFDGELRWSHDADCDEVKYLFHAFHRLAAEVDAGVAGADLPPFPGAALPFYRSLVSSLLDALSQEASCAAWAEELGSFWPGIDQAERLAPSGT